jgi:hypothetical protein
MRVSILIFHRKKYFLVSRNSKTIKLVGKITQSFLEKENLPGLKTISEKIEENLNIYLKPFVLLYADDTKTSYIACLAFSDCFVIALLKFPVLFKSIPR